MVNPFDLPIHPIAAHFPVAMLTAAWVCLVLRYLLVRPALAGQAFVFEAIGVASLPVTIVAGFVDTRGFDVLTEPRFSQPLVWHVISGLVTSIVFAGHLAWARRRDREPDVRGATIDLVWVTLGLWAVIMAGAIAGELVYAG